MQLVKDQSSRFLSRLTKFTPATGRVGSRKSEEEWEEWGQTLNCELHSDSAIG